MKGSRLDDSARTMVNLSRAESLRLLAGVPFGRVVFTRDALPAIRPVNHYVDDGVVIVRTRLSSRLTSAVHAESEVVVAYEADDIDRENRLGWSVVVTGIARTVTDPELIARYDELVRPWIDGVMDSIVAIEPTLVTGVRLLERDALAPEAD
ncbi:pyridoxamine 5'-phosphate oxidase family protein [Nocardia sp. ET3-3]|uniref:Pyridoxamine 5'-phosphate oxidase family protein n=1 Tax=Nocardia terrae TaxID=2675851 RepID=A0A7K1UUZ6_9NOCA|nr:pyridoxamine 5'-phosphate oxidase family protein [Nocardia terrae]MVU78184.1 pyridoxamine 5'-phosphate oxidase family protein [Nocardia terrae]